MENIYIQQSNKIDIKKLIREFFRQNVDRIIPERKNKENKNFEFSLADNTIYNYTIYNEFSFQHELGIFLREKLNKNNKNFEYYVYFEKNYKSYIKSEKEKIDIVILKKGDNKFPLKEFYAIELKFPCNGEYPESMYNFVKDIKFMEDVKNKSNIIKTYCVVLVNDDNFYLQTNKRKKDGIYQYFRSPAGTTQNFSINIPETVYKPTGKNKGKEKLHIHGYNLNWESPYGELNQKLDENMLRLKYYILEI